MKLGPLHSLWLECKIQKNLDGIYSRSKGCLAVNWPRQLVEIELQLQLQSFHEILQLGGEKIFQ